MPVTDPNICTTRIFLVSPCDKYTDEDHVYDISNVSPTGAKLQNSSRAGLAAVKNKSLTPMLTERIPFNSTTQSEFYDPSTNQKLADVALRSMTSSKSSLALSSLMGNRELHLKQLSARSRTENFGFGGALFSWEQDSPSRPNFAHLMKAVNGSDGKLHTMPFGQCMQTRRLRYCGFSTKIAGIVLLNDRQTDWRVALITFMGMVKKIINVRSRRAGSAGGREIKIYRDIGGDNGYNGYNVDCYDGSCGDGGGDGGGYCDGGGGGGGGC